VLDLPQLVEIFEIVAICLLVACTAWLVRRSMPATLEFRQKRIEAISAELASKVGEIVDERAVWKLQGERLAEEVEGFLGQIERKRASTAASASRIDKGGAAQVKPADLSRADQLAWARAQG